MGILLLEDVPRWPIRSYKKMFFSDKFKKFWLDWIGVAQVGQLMTTSQAEIKKNIETPKEPQNSMLIQLLSV